MKTKTYKFGREGREAIKKVAETIGDVLGSTLGPAGRNYLTPTGVTNDGKTIAREIIFEDEAEDLIAVAIREAIERTDKEVGDGTTTAGVMTTQLACDALKKVADIDVPLPDTQHVMAIARQLDEEKDRALKLLESKRRVVSSKEELEHVAFTSMEDRPNSKLLAETIWTAGKDTFPVIDEGFNGKIETEITAGIKVPFAVATPFMHNNLQKQAIHHDMPVLVANHIFEQYKELAPFMQTMMSEPKSTIPGLVIVAKQFAIDFVKTVVATSQATKFPILLVSNPHADNDAFEDIAAFCDATVIDTHPKGAKQISDASFAYAGRIKKIVASDKDTVLIGGRGLQSTILQGNGMASRVQARADAIKDQLASEKLPDKRMQMERRIASLLGGITTIYVDAKTAAERYYLKLKVEDAVNSCRNALETGMLRGGGITLREVAEELGPESLLYGALKAPHQRILRNAGGNLEIGEDVFDSFAVVKAGIENAVSVVKILLTTEGVIADVPRSLVEDLRTSLNR